MTVLSLPAPAIVPLPLRTMSYSEAAYRGPDIFGQTFVAEHCQHIAAWEEHQRLERRRRVARIAYERRRRRSLFQPKI